MKSMKPIALVMCLILASCAPGRIGSKYAVTPNAAENKTAFDVLSENGGSQKLTWSDKDNGVVNADGGANSQFTVATTEGQLQSFGQGSARRDIAISLTSDPVSHVPIFKVLWSSATDISGKGVKFTTHADGSITTEVAEFSTSSSLATAALGSALQSAYEYAAKRDEATRQAFERSLQALEKVSPDLAQTVQALIKSLVPVPVP